MIVRTDYHECCEQCPANFGILKVEEDPEDPENDLLKVNCITSPRKRKCGLNPY